MTSGVFLRLALATAVIALLGGSASSLTLAPGENGFVTGATLAERPDLAGEIVNDTLAGYYDFDPAAALTAGHSYQNRVIRSDETGVTYRTNGAGDRGRALPNAPPMAIC